jgi:hypothetical protein
MRRKSAGGCAPCYASIMCKVCKSPPETLAAVNQMLKDKITLSKIAEFSGIHRSIVGRHSLQCVPKEVLKTHRQNFYHGERVVVVYEDESRWPFDATPGLLYHGTPTELRPDDTVLVVRYEQIGAAKAYKEKLQAFLSSKPAIAANLTTAEEKRAALQKQIVADYEAQKNAPPSDQAAEKEAE